MYKYTYTDRIECHHMGIYPDSTKIYGVEKFMSS